MSSDEQFWRDVDAGKAPDPVHYVAVPEKLENGEVTDAPGWYFWTETWADRCGPYASIEEARAKLAEYCCVVLGHDPGKNCEHCRKQQ